MHYLHHLHLLQQFGEARLGFAEEEHLRVLSNRSCIPQLKCNYLTVCEADNFVQDGLCIITQQHISLIQALGLSWFDSLHSRDFSLVENVQTGSGLQPILNLTKFEYGRGVVREEGVSTMDPSNNQTITFPLYIIQYIICYDIVNVI